MSPADVWKRTDYLVELTEFECINAAINGIFRRNKSLFAGDRKDCYAKSKGDQYWDRDIEGHGAETAVAKHVNWYQQPRIRNFNCLDVGPHIQVRHTHHKTGHLLIRPGDKPGLYVLVTGRMPRLTIVGCYSGVLAKEHYPLSLGPTQDGDPGHWLPQADLHPFPPRSEWRGKRNPLHLFLEPEYWEKKQVGPQLVKDAS